MSIETKNFKRTFKFGIYLLNKTSLNKEYLAQKFFTIMHQ
jgi:hypothetical protein